MTSISVKKIFVDRYEWFFDSTCCILIKGSKMSKSNKHDPSSNTSSMLSSLKAPSPDQNQNPAIPFCPFMRVNRWILTKCQQHSVPTFASDMGKGCLDLWCRSRRTSHIEVCAFSTQVGVLMAWVETQSLQSLACRFISFAPFRCDSHSPDQKLTYMVRAAKRYYIVELNIFFGLWMPNMQKSFVRKSWLQDRALQAFLVSV